MVFCACGDAALEFHSLDNRLKSGTERKPLIPVAETIKKWEAAGGEFGWVSLTKLSALGGREFSIAEQEPQPDWLPAFRVREIAKANFPDLPDPNVPFAITVSNTNFDNKQLKAITKFRQLTALDLRNTVVSDDSLLLLILSYHAWLWEGE